jgi:acetoin utilization deacetylase AcuC-like enzyme
MTTRLWCDSRFEQHVAGPMHPESPGRLQAIGQVLDRAPIAGTVVETPRPATREELLRVHRPAHVDHVLSLHGQSAQLDPDTAMSPGSAEAALLAAGAAVDATLAVMQRRTTNAFALVRPPGHHAEADHAMGFCLFNNVAVAAEAARHSGAERVLVLDWDVHHGNGTQHTFEARRDVLFCSSHQFPYYPGTGAPTETGVGAGAGYTVNVALPGGRTDADFGAVFHDVFLPIARAYRPDVVLVSAGFDAHRADPIGGMNVTERGFAAMASAMKQLAEQTCEGRLVLLLEGGYDLDALGQSVHACVEVMAGHRRDEFPSGVSAQAAAAIDDTRAALAGSWPRG